MHVDMENEGRNVVRYVNRVLELLIFVMEVGMGGRY